METITTFKGYAAAVRRRWWLPAALAAIALVGAHMKFGGPRWVAPTMLMPTVSPAGPPAPGVPNQGQQLQPQSSSVVNDIVQLLGTQALAERVARRVNMTVRDVQNSVAASVPRNTDIVLIQVTSRTPGAAANNANIVADELINYYREINARDAHEARQFIEKQLAEARVQLDASDNVLGAARGEPLSLEGAPLAALNRYFALSAALDEAQRALRERDARAQATSSGLKQERPTQVSEMDVQGSPVYEKLQSSLTDLEIQKAQLGRVFTSQYPPLQVLDEQIRALKTRLLAEPKTEVARQVNGANPVYAHLLLDMATLRVDRAAAAAQITTLKSIVREHQATFSSLAAAQTRAAQMLRENQILAANYSTLAAKYRDAVLREHSAQFFPAGLQIVQRAVPPLSPWGGFVWIALAACAVALVLGTAGAIALEALDENVRTPEEVEATLGAAVLAQVPNARGPRRRFAWGTVRSVIALLLVLSLAPLVGSSPPSSRGTGVAVQTTMAAALPSQPGRENIVVQAGGPDPVTRVQHRAERDSTPGPREGPAAFAPATARPEPTRGEIIPARDDVTPGTESAPGRWAAPPRPSGFQVQAGAFNTLAYARDLVGQLRARGYHPVLAEMMTASLPHRVWVGAALDRSSAVRLVARLRAEGFEAILIPPPTAK